MAITMDEIWNQEFEKAWIAFRPNDPICYEEYEEHKELAKKFYLLACQNRYEEAMDLIKYGLYCTSREHHGYM